MNATNIPEEIRQKEIAIAKDKASAEADKREREAYIEKMKNERNKGLNNPTYETPKELTPEPLPEIEHFNDSQHTHQ